MGRRRTPHASDVLVALSQQANAFTVEDEQKLKPYQTPLSEVRWRVKQVLCEEYHIPLLRVCFVDHLLNVSQAALAAYLHKTARASEKAVFEFLKATNWDYDYG